MSVLGWLWSKLGDDPSAMGDHNMIECTKIEEFHEAFKEAGDQPIFVFKHSTSCPVSAGAWKRMREYIDAAPDDVPLVYMLKVQEARTASRLLAEELNVTHQSPQLILVVEGKAIWDTSHGSINKGNIEKALEGYEPA